MVDPLPAAATIGLDDTRSAASAAALAAVAANDREPAAGVPPAHVAHRSQTLAELDTSVPRSLLPVVSANAEPDAESFDDTDDDGSTLAVAGEPVMESATESEDELPTLDAAMLAHFLAIQSALTFREGMLARALAAELTPGELRAWMAELRELSVADAAARIRSVLADEAADDAAGGGS
jgi:hypothetical protein